MHAYMQGYNVATHWLVVVFFFYFLFSGISKKNNIMNIDRAVKAASRLFIQRRDGRIGPRE